MQPKVIALLVFSVCMGVVGQFFFKTGVKAAAPNGLEFGPSVVLMFFKPMIFAGLCCYAISTVSWLVILSKVPLSVAYPCISAGYVLVVLMGRFLFNEQLNAYMVGGVVLICLGVLLIGFGKQKATSMAPPEVQVAEVAMAHFMPE